MKVAFVDTAGWMMLADAGDPAHRAAVQFRDRDRARGRLESGPSSRVDGRSFLFATRASRRMIESNADIDVDASRR